MVGAKEKFFVTWYFPNSKAQAQGAYMGPTWGRQDPGEPYVGPMNFAIWVIFG